MSAVVWQYYTIKMLVTFDACRISRFIEVITFAFKMRRYVACSVAGMPPQYKLHTKTTTNE
jgi:hypothetical protein